MSQPESGLASTRTPRGVWVVTLATVLFHGATWRGYGVFRDELYYSACAERLAWGYVDHPPFSLLVLRLFDLVFGPLLRDPLLVLRGLLPLLAAALVFTVAGMARDLGGGRWAQLCAALATALAPGVLALHGFYSMNALDLLFWALAGRALVRVLRDGDGPGWLLFGALAGLGLLNKISVLLLGFGLVVGLVVSRRWGTLKSPWLWLGGALAALLFLPHVIWQALHGWPTLEFMERAAAVKNVDLDPLAFLSEQLLFVGPANVVVLLAGVGWLLSARAEGDDAARPWSVLGFGFLAVLLVMLSTSAKPYYLVAAYAVPFAAGGVALERASDSWRAARALRAFFAASLVVSGLVALPLSKAVLPVEAFVAYQRWLGVAASSGEQHEQGRLPQHFADMHGWREMAETVAQVYRSLPADEREVACVFGQNYGEAGAIEYFAEELGLPTALAGHNNYYLWGPRGCSGAVVIVIGDEREGLEQVFGRVERAATFNCRDCMPYENGSPIWVARRPVEPLDVLWPRTQHYD